MRAFFAFFFGYLIIIRKYNLRYILQEC